MSLVTPARSKAVLEQGTYGPRLVIPAPRRIGFALFICVWLGGWAWGLVSAVKDLQDPGTHGEGRSFIALWLTLWILGGAWAVLTVLWTLMGREIITIEQGYLTVRQELFGLGRSRAYALQDVRDVRVRQPVGQWSGARSLQMPQPSFKNGTIAFDYGARTYGFGCGLEEGEAKLILEELRPYLK